MGWMPRRLMLLLASSALLLAPLISAQLAMGSRRAHACSCFPPPPPLEALDGADAVFTGRVVSFRTFSFEVETDNGWTLPYWSVEFAVDRVWKGPITSTTFIYVWPSATCGYGWFEQGESFLVFARHSRDPEVDEDAFFAGKCSRTQRLEHAEDELQALGDGWVSELGITGALPASSDEEQTADPGETGTGPASRDPLRSLAWWAPLLAGIAAAALIFRRWAGRREPE